MVQPDGGGWSDRVVGRERQGDLGGGVVRQDVIRVQVAGGQTRAAQFAQAGGNVRDIRVYLRGDDTALPTYSSTYYT